MRRTPFLAPAFLSGIPFLPSPHSLTSDSNRLHHFVMLCRSLVALTFQDLDGNENHSTFIGEVFSESY